jgi:ubiquinone/menaquinone biosynthesis C-methylase UbiE
LQEFERKQTENQNYVHEAIERISSKSLCRLYLKFGHQLANIVLGEVSPLDILHDDLQLLADANDETVESLQIIKHLEGFLEALAHKLPALKVLEIGAGTGAMAKAIHKILGNDSISAQYGSYTFTDVEPHFIETAAENFLAQKKMEFRALDIGSEPSMQGYTEHSYDLIVVSNALYRTRTVERSLANNRKLLKLGGKLILVEPTVSESVRDGLISALFSGWWPDTEGRETQDPYASEENWGQLLNSGGFSGLDATFRGDQNTKLHSWSLMISTAVAATTQIIRVPPEITVIVDQESQTQIKILTDLRLRLQNSGTPVSNVVSFQEVSRLKSLETRHYIILCDIERPLLLGISPEGFMTLKFLLSSAKGILWVTGGAQCLSTPNYGMVQGLCRVSHQEHMDVQLVTLALQETSVMMPVGNSCGRNIAKVFSLMTTKFTEGNFETEYVEMDGCLHINRLVEDRTLNEHISAMTTHSRILQRFGEGPPLKLDVPVPGVLESLIFVEDPLYYQPLAPEEIEIEVRAIGVNFKDCLTVLG